MGVIGEAVVVLRPDTLGFGAAAKKGIGTELGASDVFGGVSSSANRTRKVIGDDFTAAGLTAGDAMDHASSRISRSFESAGNTLGNFGVPFAGALSKVGAKIDDSDTKGQHLNRTVSALGGTLLGVGAIGAAAVAGESVHLAMGLQTADAQIASHENISVNAANNIGKAFLSTAGKVPFSANQLASSFAPVSGELDQIAGHALSAGQTLKFVSETGDLAEATNTDLGTTTQAVGSIMQAFQVPLKGVKGLTNDLFNTSRITDVGLGSLASTVDRLKARLGVAAPTVGDLSTLLVDLNEHGVQGSKGLLVVNTAANTLLQSVPKVDAATAKAANTLATKLTSASATASKVTATVATDQQNAATKIAAAAATGQTQIAAAQTRLQDVNDRIAASSTAGAPTTSQQIEQANAEAAVQKAQTDAATRNAAAQASATQTVSKAQAAASTETAKLTALQATAGTSTNLQVQAMQKLGLQVYNSSGSFVGMRSIISQLSPVLHGMTQEQQLATTTQIFGASASKALLSTVLAGPAAYDKASKAVTDSSTAHAGAVKQAQTLGREAEVVKSALIDEGDKLGLFLIPKLEELARDSAEAVRWMEKHKTVAEALAITLGVIAAGAVAVFAVNLGVKWVKAAESAGKSIVNLASTVGEKLGLIQAEEEDSEETTESTAQRFSTAADQISESMTTSSSNIVYALQLISEQLDEMIGSFDAARASIATDLDGVSSSAATTAEEVDTSLGGVTEGLGTLQTNTGLWVAGTQADLADVEASFGSLTAGVGESLGGLDGEFAQSALGAQGWADKLLLANGEVDTAFTTTKGSTALALTSLSSSATVSGGEVESAFTGMTTVVDSSVSTLSASLSGVDGSLTTVGTTATDMSAAVSVATGQVESSFVTLAASVETSVASVEGSAGTLSAAFGTAEGGATGLATSTSTSLAEVDSSFTTLVTDSTIAAEKVSANYAEMGLAAEGFAGKAAIANEAAGASSVVGGAGGLAGKGAAGAARTAATVGEEVAPEAGLLGGASLGGAALGAATTGGIGLIGVQLYNSLAEKKVGHLIGTNAASALGDAGTGAAIGAGIGSVVPGLGTALGAGVGAAAGLAFAEKKPIEKGVDYATGKLEDVFGHSAAGKGAAIGTLILPGVGTALGGLIGGLFGGGHAAPKPHPTELQANKDHSTNLAAKLDTLAQLQRAAYIATASQGPNSAAAKAATQALYSTESKWLPHLGKLESLKSVDRSMFLATLDLDKLKSEQANIAKGGDIKDTTKQISALHATLKTEKASGASESTLKLTQSQISAAKERLDALHTVAQKISRDETTIKKADETKASIDKVNHQIELLRTDIKTTPPPKQHATGTLKLKITAR